MFTLLDPVLAFGLAAVKTLGLPALVVLFVLKGALVGKVFPTSLLLPGYVLVIGATYVDAVFVVLAVTAAHVAGQIVLYVGTARYGPVFLDRLPGVSADAAADSRLTEWFDRYGGVAVFGTNLFPWTRGLIAIPASMSSYPLRSYTLHITVAALVYHTAYVAGPVAGLALFTS